MAQVEFNVPGPGTYLIEADPSLPPLSNPGQASDMLEGEQFYDEEGNPVTGTMPSNPAISETLEAGESVQVQAGYTPGGTVQAASLASQTPGTATQDDIIQGQTAWVNGVQITGALEPGTSTEDATATAADILAPETAYVATGKVSGTMPARTSDDVTIQNTTISVASGYYPPNTTKQIQTVEQATPSISVSDGGLITATAQQAAGFVAEGTKSATQQLPVQGAQTITPGTTVQTIQANLYLTGAQTIQGDANLVPENIKDGTAIFGVTGTYEGQQTSFSVPLTVTVDTGATVTAVNGDTMLTATSVNGQAHFVLTSGGTWQISAELGDETGQAEVVVSDSYVTTITLEPPVQIYGAEWDGSSNPAWTRTDAAANFSDPNPAVNNGDGSSPFDNILPWSGMQIVEDETAGTLVSIPKYYYKWTRTGASMKLQISTGPQDGFLTSPAHADRGDGQGERDVVYVGRYHCASGYKSQTGVRPLDNTTRAVTRTNIHNLGTDIWQYDFAMYWTIMMLYLVEYANWNSQDTIGYGCSPGGAIFNMGLTDSMQYHTGTSAASRTTYGCCQYRHIEGLWDNVMDWCDGIYFSGASVYCIKNPASFSDTSGGILVGTRATSASYISAWTNPTASGFEYALYPNEVAGADDEYICDYCYYASNGVVLRVGGSYSQAQYRGTFCLDGYYSTSAWGITASGTRLQKLP